MKRILSAMALVVALALGGAIPAQAQETQAQGTESPPGVDQSIEMIPLENIQQEPEAPPQRPRRARRERPASPPAAPALDAAAPERLPAQGPGAAAGRSIRSAEGQRERANQGVITVLAGGVNGTYIRIASDMAAVLDDGERMRILPVVGKGSVQNITDLLYLRGMDIAIVQSDVLEVIRKENLHPTIDQRIRYVTKLYNEEVHILAGRDVVRLADLAGRKVNVDVAGGGTAATAATLFSALGLTVEQTNFDQPLALEKLKNGEIAAMVYVAGKPTGLFYNIERGSGLHFVPIPLNAELLHVYMPSSLTSNDYPSLIDETRPIDTVAVGAVMAVYNWERDSERYRRTAAFVNAFFDQFEAFLKPPRHPKWQEVNLATELPGWTRFAPAQQWLDRRPSTVGAGYDLALKNSFDEFLKFMEIARGRGGGEPRDSDALFERFLQWRAAQASPQQPVVPPVPAGAVPR